MQFHPPVHHSFQSDIRGNGWPALVAIALAATLLGFPHAAADDESELTDAAYAEDRIASLIAQLDSQDPDERNTAIHGLGRLGPEARAAIPRLIDLLSDGVYEVEDPPFIENVVIYDSAMRSLIAIGAESAAPLVSRFPDESDDVQNRCAQIARFIGPDARHLLPVIHARYERTEGHERSQLLCAMAAIDPTGEFAVPVLLMALLEDPYAEVRQTAALFLQRTTPLTVYWDEAAPAVHWFDDDGRDPIAVADALRQALNDESPGVRATAAIALAAYPDSAELSIPLLSELLTDTDSFEVWISNHLSGSRPVATEAGTALAAFPQFADITIPRLVDAALAPEGAHLRLNQPIGRLVPHCERPFDHLNRLLESDHPELALLAVARLGSADDAALARISALMTDEAAVTLCCIDADGHPEALEVVQSAISEPGDLAFSRRNVCGYITDVGPNAAFAVPLLTENVIDAEDAERLNYDVVKALGSIGPAAAAAARPIIGRLDSDIFLQEFYEQHLTSLGPAIVPLLVEALEDDSQSAAHRIGCLHVLGSFGSEASDAIPAVLPFLETEFPRVRQTAVKTLGQIAVRPDESLPALQRALSDPRPLVRAEAAHTTAAFREDAEHLIPEVINLLADDYLDVQVAAGNALRQFGPSANAAVPQLEELSQSDNQLLRETAINALESFRAVD